MIVQQVSNLQPAQVACRHVIGLILTGYILPCLCSTAQRCSQTRWLV